MKRNTPQHPKTVALANALGIEQHAAVGLLECLWHWSATYAQDGLLRATYHDAMARAMFWSGETDRLLEGLVEAGWVDILEGGDHVLHDWPNHCEDSVHRSLYRKAEYFYNHVKPSSSRLTPEQKSTADRLYAGVVSTKSVLSTPLVRPAEAEAKALAEALPKPEPLPKAQPRPKPKRPSTDAGVYDALARLQNRVGELSPEKMLTKTLSATGEGNPAWVAWWGKAVDVLDPDGLIELNDIIHTAKMPEAERKAKGVGVIHSPDRWIVKKILEYSRLRRNQGRPMPLPDTPKKGDAA